MTRRILWCSWPLDIQQDCTAPPGYLWTRWSSADTGEVVFQNPEGWHNRVLREMVAIDLLIWQIWSCGRMLSLGVHVPVPILLWDVGVHQSSRTCGSLQCNLGVYGGGPAMRYSCPQGRERCSQNIHLPKVSTLYLHWGEQNDDSTFAEQQIKVEIYRPWRDSLPSMWSVGTSLPIPALVSQPLESELLPFQKLEGGNVYPFPLLTKKKEPGFSEWSDWQEGEASPSSHLRRGLPGALTSQDAWSAAVYPGGGSLDPSQLPLRAHQGLGMGRETDSSSWWP